jgi:hypothetical protein
MRSHFHQSRTTFFLKIVDAQIAFLTDRDGNRAALFFSSAKDNESKANSGQTIKVCDAAVRLRRTLQVGRPPSIRVGRFLLS